MIPIYYKSSEGVVVNLIETPYRMLTETDLLNSEWEPTTVGENFPRITRLDKKQVSPKFKIRVTGSTKTEMANNLEHLESVFDRDCFLNQMGRLYIGEFYRECFITGITHGKVFEKSHTVAEYVATSNNGYWVSNKEISFSGSGALVGEIADKMYVSASHRSQDIIYTPQADHTAHLEWSANTFGDQWIRFDLGGVTQIAEFSGITLQSTDIPISCEAQISSGEVADVSRNTTITTLVESNNIKDYDVKKIRFDSVGEYDLFLRDHELYMWCYMRGQSQRVREFFINDLEHEWIDISDYDTVTLWATHSGEVSVPIEYTTSDEQWTTVETYRGDSTVVLEDIECSSIRLRGNYIGYVNADLSVVSDEEAPVRNLLNLGYQLENLSETKSEDWIIWVVNDTTQNGYITFDDYGLNLRHIECEEASSTEIYGLPKVQGLVNNEWVDVCEIESELSQDFLTSYEKIRIEIPPYFLNATNLSIDVITDARIINDSYAPSNAIIEISEMPNNPSVVIGGVEYGADIELSQGHKLVIDTKKKRVRDYADEDTYENVYASRMGDFTQIETGENEVTWGGNANIKITLEQARSIPKWN